MKRKELTKTFMMISNVKQLCSPWFFIRFQIVFFAVIYDLLIIHSSYFNSGFCCGKQNDRPPMFTYQHILFK